MPDEDKPKQDKPKIIVDDDWKAEAQKEKERLAAEASKQAASAAPGVAAAPVADFAGIVNVLAMQAMVSLGGIRGPDGRTVPPNLEMAKYHIDLLDALEQKCRDNLSAEEKQLIDVTLYELRMQYVRLAGAGTIPGAGVAGTGAIGPPPSEGPKAPQA